MPARQNWFEGWRLFALLSLILLALSIWIAGMRSFEADGVRMVIRFTARTSLMLSASLSARARWRGCGPMAGPDGSAATGASSASPSPRRTASTPSPSLFRGDGSGRYVAATSAASYMFGGIGYAFIIAMTATSFDRTAQPRSARAPFAFCILPAAITSVPVHGVLWQADPRHAALRAVPGAAARGVGAAADRDGVGAHARGAHGMTNRPQADDIPSQLAVH